MTTDRRSSVQGHPQGLLPLAGRGATRSGCGTRSSSRPSGAGTWAGSPRVGDMAAKKCGIVLLPAARSARRRRRRRRRSSRCSAGPPPRTSRPTARSAHSEEDARRKVIQRVRAHELADEGERHRVAVGPEQAHHLLHRREAGRFPGAGARPRVAPSAPGSSCGRSASGTRRPGSSASGRCGREYCCSTWLTELSPVNLGLAKDQHLSLNPSQISGGCGRLLCCLKYEHEFYVTARKRFPKEGKTLRTARRRREGHRGRHLPRAGLPPAARSTARASSRWSSCGTRSSSWATS